jgi:hypothetical protein
MVGPSERGQIAEVTLHRARIPYRKVKISPEI